MRSGASHPVGSRLSSRRSRLTTDRSNLAADPVRSLGNAAVILATTPILVVASTLTVSLAVFIANASACDLAVLVALAGRTLFESTHVTGSLLMAAIPTRAAGRLIACHFAGLIARVAIEANGGHARKFFIADATRPTGLPLRPCAPCPPFSESHSADEHEKAYGDPNTHAENHMSR
jgi:hypothetical protein